jgi:hypothetical protein
MTMLFAKPFPIWGKIVSVLLIAWNGFGLWSLYTQVTMTPEVMAQLPKAQQAIWNSMPSWLWVIYAVAVLAGTAGAVLLFLRKALAKPLFHLCLVSVILQFGYVLAATPILKTVGLSAAIFPAMIITVAAIQWSLSRNWLTKGWLN